MKRVVVAVAVVLTAIWYFQKNPSQKISESIEVQEDIEISATVEESQSRSPAMQMPLSAEAASSNAIKDEVLALSRKSMPFSELEDAEVWEDEVGALKGDVSDQCNKKEKYLSLKSKRNKQ